MSVLTLTAAKQHLNIKVPDYDAELQATIDAAEDLIGQAVGPLTPTAVTDRVNISGGYSFTLRTTPVISLTSATSIYGTSTADVSQLFVSPSGVVTWRDGISRFYWGAYDVVYQAGYASIPDGLLYAVKEMVRHLWKSQQGGGARPGTAPETQTAGYLFPNIVREAMEPYVQEFGFA